MCHRVRNAVEEMVSDLKYAFLFQINALSQSQFELQSELASMKTLVLVFLIVIVCLLLAVLWMVSTPVGEESVPFNATTVIADNVSKSDL